MVVFGQPVVLVGERLTVVVVDVSEEFVVLVVERIVLVGVGVLVGG